MVQNAVNRKAEHKETLTSTWKLFIDVGTAHSIPAAISHPGKQQ